MPWSLVVWALLAGAGQTSERVLDLTRKSEDETKLKADQQLSYRGGCRGQTTGRLEASPPFTIAVQTLNSEEYSMGGLIVADLRVTNTGKEGLALPWVLRHEFGDDDAFAGPDAVQVALGIAIVDAEGREQGLTGAILRGALSREGTTQTIVPGESIRIRFPGHIPFIDSPTAPITGDAQVFATLTFSDGACRTWEPVRSRRVNIRFRGRD